MKIYTWNTPNGQKPVIAAEELGLSYQLVPVDLGAGQQREAPFLAINPNGKIPALVDNVGGASHRVFESGAVLLHLASRRDGLLPADDAGRAEVLGWCFWQVGGLGPMLGQYGHFATADEPHAPAVARFGDESLRLLGVLERQLADHAHVAGEGYTLADVMLWPWVKGGLPYLKGYDEAAVTSLTATVRWVARVGERPAVKRAMAKLEAMV